MCLCVSWSKWHAVLCGCCNCLLALFLVCQHPSQFHMIITFEGTAPVFTHFYETGPQDEREEKRNIPSHATLTSLHHWVWRHTPVIAHPCNIINPENSTLPRSWPVEITLYSGNHLTTLVRNSILTPLTDRDVCYSVPGSLLRCTVQAAALLCSGTRVHYGTGMSWLLLRLTMDHWHHCHVYNRILQHQTSWAYQSDFSKCNFWCLEINFNHWLVHSASVVCLVTWLFLRLKDIWRQVYQVMNRQILRF